MQDTPEPGPELDQKRPVEAEALANAILEVKSRIFRCSTCNNMTDVDPCTICSDARRDPSVICVVEEAFNIEIPDEAAEKIQKVKDAVAYIEKNSSQN